MGRRLGGGAVLLVVLAVAVLLGGAYAVAYAFAADRLPRGTSIAHTSVGGMSPEEARVTLGNAFEGHTSVDVEVAGKRVTLPADQLGLSLDLDATIEAAGGGHSLDPRRLWDYYAGGDEVAPVLTVDEEKFEAALVALEKEHGRPAREGAVTFKGAEVERTSAQPGLGLDRDDARAALSAAYSTGDPATLVLVQTAPAISDEDVAKALEEFGNRAVSGPVTLVFDKTPVKLEPAEFTPALTMVDERGVLVPHLDDKVLGTIVRDHLGEGGLPVDATVKLVNGVPTVVPGKPGVDYEPADVSAAFLSVVVAPPGQRSLPVKATVKEPEVSAADAEKWGIKEKVSTFTTYYPHTDYRNVNIPRALSLIDGTVLQPGDTFSLNGTVGQRTKANGFVEGFVIDGGQITTALGGGVSQVATTTFNAAFFAGLKDIQHKPHSLYFDRYPVGREATVAWPTVDLKFQNDTPYGVLIHTSVQRSTPGRSGVVTVSMYSTKYWDITTTTGARYNIKKPGSRVSTAPDCTPQDPNTGFDIKIQRHFNRNGQRVRSETMTTHYNSADTVTCKKPVAKSASPSPSPSATH